MSEGVVIDQRFQLGRVIRESRLAVVYEARDRDGADVWIKLPREPEHEAALLAEMRVAKALGKSAVAISDDGCTEDGSSYLVLEPVTGQPLDQWRAQTAGRAPVDEVMRLGDELCQAIGRMHRAGFSVGLLRTQAILVLSPGGVCLLELEHSKPASEAAVREDVARVGSVLYEMLSGKPHLTQSAPLYQHASELPLAMCTTVDDAARGRYATIDELRSALAASLEAAASRPMPSASPESEWADIVLPRSSKLLFDPADIVDSSRSLGRELTPTLPPAPGPFKAAPTPRLGSLSEPVLALEQAALWERGPAIQEQTTESGPMPSGPGFSGWPSPSRPSSGDLEAPPMSASNASERIRPEPLPRRMTFAIVAGAGSAALLVCGAIAFVTSSAKHAEGEPPAPVAKRAALVVVAPASAPPPIVAPAAAPPPADSATETAPAAVSSSAVPVAAAPAPSASGAAADSNETILSFEGNPIPRLVIYDGVMVGTTTKPVNVRCGTHAVKIGGKGVSRALSLPCGGEQVIDVEQNGTWRAR